ncbi:MAG: glycosyltransferase family 2 protein [Bryobacteraceae bacterium]
MTDVSVVIVTYQSADVIARCLESCLGRAREVIVIDNASTDGTAAVVQGYPRVRLIANRENRGFAGGVNQGVALATSSMILLLNPDAAVTQGLDELRAAGLQYGAATGRLTDPSGASQQAFHIRRFPTPVSLSCEVLGLNRLFPSNPANRRYRCLDLPADQPAFVEQPAGAFFLFERRIWEQLGGFDERFQPAWFEDVDFCKRLLGNGFAIRYVPAAEAIHSGGHSARQLDWSTRERYWYGSLLKYAGKHFSRSGLAVVCLAVMGGALLRAVMGMVRFQSMEPVFVYAKVIRLASRYLVLGDRGALSPPTNNTQASIHGF